MAEECSASEVPVIREDNISLECEMSEPQSVKADNSQSDKNALPLPVSGAMSGASTTPVSDSEGAINLEDMSLKEGALTLPVSGATSAAASTPVSDSECAINAEEVQGKEGGLTLPVSAVNSTPVSGATSAAMSTPVSDSECAIHVEDTRVREGALTLTVSGATSDSESAMSPGDLNMKAEALMLSVSRATSAAASTSDSGCAMSPDAKGSYKLQVSGAASAAVSDSSSENPNDKPTKDDACSPEPSAPIQISGSAECTQEILSPEKVAEMLSTEKEKVGIFKGVKSAIKTKVKQVWKKLSPKKPERAALTASAQESESKESPTTDKEKKPYKVVTYVSATRSGSLVLNSVASDEVTLDTDLPTSGSEVFLPDEASIATCDTSTHASRLPSLGESCSEPSEESPEHNTQESTGDRADEAADDRDVAESS